MKNTETILYKLIAAGFGKCDDVALPSFVDWKRLWMMASQQGVSAICLDGIQLIDKEYGSLVSR